MLPFFSGVRVIACSLPYFGFPAICCLQELRRVCTYCTMDIANVGQKRLKRNILRRFFLRRGAEISFFADGISLTHEIAYVLKIHGT